MLNSLLIRPSLRRRLPYGPVLHGLGELTQTMGQEQVLTQHVLINQVHF